MVNLLAFVFWASFEIKQKKHQSFQIRLSTTTKQLISCNVIFHAFDFSVLKFLILDIDYNVDMLWSSSWNSDWLTFPITNNIGLHEA